VIVEVENLGPIKRGEVKLKPLTVFIGPNNTGKTYLAYLISGLCKDLRIRRHIFSHIRRRRKPIYVLSEKEINNILEKGYLDIKINLEDILTENFEYIVDILKKLSEHPIPAKNFVEDFWRFLGGDRKDVFSNLNVVVNIPDIDPDKIKDMVYEKSGFILGHTSFGEYWLNVSMFKEPKSYQTNVNIRIAHKVRKKRRPEIGAMPTFFNQFLSRSILYMFIKVLLQPFLSDIVIFPPQRNALTLDFIKSAINIATREEEQDMGLLFSKPERLIKSTPILNFLRMIDLLDEDIKSEFYDLGQKLEKVLGGHLAISESKGEEEIRFVIDNEKSLKLTTTSSMVQQLSSLVLYLKHQAELTDLIVIDEPESNLHPEAQIKVAEIIAEMVNRGLWVIITTHSPFILEHINMLMKSYVVAKLGDETRKSVLEIIKNERALLDPEKVGVYLFTKEGLIENVKRDYIIDAESFRRVSDEIGATFTELLIIEDLFRKNFEVR